MQYEVVSFLFFCVDHWCSHISEKILYSVISSFKPEWLWAASLYLKSDFMLGPVSIDLVI